MSDVKKDIKRAEKDVWETALDYSGPAGAVAGALVGGALGRKAFRIGANPRFRDLLAKERRGEKMSRREQWVLDQLKTGQLQSTVGSGLFFGAAGGGMAGVSASARKRDKNRK